MFDPRALEHRAARFAKEAIADYDCAISHGLYAVAHFAASRAREHAAAMRAAKAIADRQDAAKAMRAQEVALRKYVFG